MRGCRINGKESQIDDPEYWRRDFEVSFVL